MTRPANFIDMTGKRFGRLVVLREAPKKPGVALTRWHCLCDCGKKTTTFGSTLRNGTTKSCGCLHKEITGAILKNRNKNYGGMWQEGGSFDEVFADY